MNASSTTPRARKLSGPQSRVSLSMTVVGALLVMALHTGVIPRHHVNDLVSNAGVYVASLFQTPKHTAVQVKERNKLGRRVPVKGVCPENFVVVPSSPGQDPNKLTRIDTPAATNMAAQVSTPIATAQAALAARQNLIALMDRRFWDAASLNSK